MKIRIQPLALLFLPLLPALALLLQANTAAIAQSVETVIANPPVSFTSIMQASDGNYYATYAGSYYSNGAPTCPTGAYDACGAIYQIKPDGTVTEIKNFPGSGQAPVYGAQPVNLVEGPDGYLYGTTLAGSPDQSVACTYYIGGCGTFFKVALDGTNFTILHNFTYAEHGQGGYIVLGSDGNFYGAAEANYFGADSVYKLTPTGTFTLLFSFQNGGGGSTVNGLSPTGLVEGTDGNFYGTTLEGECYRCNGTFFQITPSGNATILATLPMNGSLGVLSDGPLVEGADGAFYGLTRGSSYNSLATPLPTLFRATTAGAITVVHTFSSVSDGIYLLSPPVIAGDGNIYSTAQGGGNSASGSCTTFLGCGTLYGVSPSGTFTNLIEFAAGTTGAYPGAVIPNSSGGLTGVTAGDGGSPNVVYSSFLAGGPSAPPIKIAFYPVGSTVATLNASPNSPLTLQWNVTNAFSNTMRVCSAFRQDAVDKTWTGVQTGMASASGFGGSATITTPAIAGTYTYALTCGGVESGFATLTVGSSIQVDSNALPTATVSTPYSFTFTAHGGTKPYTWDLIGYPKPPAGLAIDPNSGTFAGTPQQYGVYQMTATVSDNSTPPLTNSATLQLVVNSGLSLIGSLPNAFVGQQYGPFVVATGGLPPYTWQLTSGQLPAGMTLNTSTGLINGTPTNTGPSTFAITVSDSEGTPAKFTQSYTIQTNVAPLYLNGTTIPCIVAQPCNYTLQATGGTPPYTYAAVGTLPKGLSVSSTGVISGMPVQYNKYEFIGISVTDSETPAAMNTGSFTFDINSGLNAVVPDLPDATVGTFYTSPLPVVTGGLPPYTFTISAPVGSFALQQFGILAGTAQFAGTPTVPTPPTDPYQIVYTFYDSESSEATVTVTKQLNVLPAQSTTTTSLKSSSSIAGAGMPVTFTATVTGANPTGMVTFSNGATSLGTAQLGTTGTAALTTSFGSTGVYSITATYSGDSANASSVSSALTETIVTVGVTAAISPATLTLQSGSVGVLTITVNPTGGYTGNITFSCGTLPANVACTFAPPTLSIAAGSGPVTDTLTIDTGASHAMLMSPRSSGATAAIYAAMALWLPGSLAAFAGLSRRKRKQPSLRGLWLLALFCLGLAAAGVVSGCGGPANAGTAKPGSYPIQINLILSGASVSTQSVSATVVVQ